MRRPSRGAPLRLALVAGLVGLAGCAVEPPLPAEDDPHLAALALPVERRVALRLAVAPVTATSRDPLDAVVWETWPGGSAAESSAAVARPSSASLAAPSSASLAAPSSASLAAPSSASTTAHLPRPARLEARPYAWAPPVPVELVDLQRRLARVLTWAVASEEVALAGDSHDWPAVGAPAPSPSARRGEAWCWDADVNADADLLVHVDLTDYQVSWVERGGWFWPDFLLFYGPGIYPIVFVPDEVYEVAIAARVHVVHVRTGRALLSRDVVGRERRALNDPQRGWSVSGLLFLYPYTLDEDVYRTVEAALLPHAVADLERSVAALLGQALPPLLARPEVAALLREGDPARARTYALVVGANGPPSDAVDRPQPLRLAQRDAEQVMDLLVGSGTTAPVSMCRELGAAATRERVLAAVRDLGREMLGSDRLVVWYSGYGRTDAEGRPALVLGGGPLLPLEELARACAIAVPPGAQVVFLLDTSFGGTGGRTYPGGLPPAAGCLAPLWERHPTWQALAASGPRQAALELEGDGQGLFAAAVLEAARTGDRDGDGVVTTVELFRAVAGRVALAARDRGRAAQLPALLGSGQAFPLLRALPRD